MRMSRFERFLPWSGAIAGLAWIGQTTLARMYATDEPGGASAQVTQEHVLMNTGSTACLVVMGVALLFFATAVRNLLRSREPSDATYSSVAFGAWITVSAALGQMAAWNKAVMSAAEDDASAATQTLGYGAYFGWLAMGVGISTAFIAFGLGGLRNALLPTWFARTTIVLGAFAMLGAAGIPPGGLVNYLILPFWLIAAAVIVAKRQRIGVQSGQAVDRPEAGHVPGTNASP
jgi:hypothetical protein